MSSPTDQRDRRLTNTIIEGIAEEKGMDPSDIETPLYEVIDPDALESLFAGRPGGSGTVKFTYCGCEVTVTDRGNVFID